MPHQLKQARKDFRPSSAMKGIGYFQNLTKFLRNCLEIFWQDFFGGISLEDFFGGILIIRSATQAHRT